MSTSQNGYPLIPTQSEPPLFKWVIPGANRTYILREGPAGYLLACYILWHHKRIQSLDNPTYDDWGYAPPKPIPGSNSYSNHGSGTAADINATEHPWGEVGTYSAWNTYRIRKRMRNYHNLIRWGGDYLHKKDEMHFEIVASEEECRAYAKLERVSKWWNIGFNEFHEILKANPTCAHKVFVG